MHGVLKSLSAEQIGAAVRERYSEVARDPDRGYNFPVGRGFAEAVGYPASLLDALPVRAAAAFAGVACPVPHAKLRPGERVIDLGCGAGLDTLYAARLVQPGGKVIGLDIAPDMIARARAAIAEAGIDHAEARLVDGRRLPVEDGWADAVIVNGVFNLTPNKSALIAEVFRVLKPGGRLVAAEIVLAAPLPPGEGETLDDWFR